MKRHKFGNNEYFATTDVFTLLSKISDEIDFSNGNSLKKDISVVLENEGVFEND